MNHRLTYVDSTHTYTLNGRRAKSVSAVAKIAPDSFALDQWRKRQVAIGLTLDPRLTERVAVDPDNRELVDQICEEALAVAGGFHAAHRGTQRHRASELADTGGALITQQQRDDADAWVRTCEHHGLEILPQHVEGFVVYPEHGVAGRFDRFARYQSRTLVVDLKSGMNSVKYPQSTAVQLAMYAHAPLVSTTIDTVGDRSTVTSWMTPPDDLDLKVGLVVLLGDGMEVGELWEVDIAHGWLGAQHALSLVGWRKAYRYGDELARQVKPATEAHVVSGPSLLDTIATARTEQDIRAVWQTAKNERRWSSQAAQAAKRRILELRSSTN